MRNPCVVVPKIIVEPDFGGLNHIKGVQSGGAKLETKFKVGDISAFSEKAS